MVHHRLKTARDQNAVGVIFIQGRKPCLKRRLNLKSLNDHVFIKRGGKPFHRGHTGSKACLVIELASHGALRDRFHFLTDACQVSHLIQRFVANRRCIHVHGNELEVSQHRTNVKKRSIACVCFK